MLISIIHSPFILYYIRKVRNPILNYVGVFIETRVRCLWKETSDYRDHKKTSDSQDHKKASDSRGEKKESDFRDLKKAKMSALLNISHICFDMVPPKTAWKCDPMGSFGFQTYSRSQNHMSEH